MDDIGRKDGSDRERADDLFAHLEPVAPEPAHATGTFVEVALKLPLRQEFTYRLPAGSTARPGHRVRVPFRGRELPGVIVRVSDQLEAAVDPRKVSARLLNTPQRI